MECKTLQELEISSSIRKIHIKTYCNRAWKKDENTYYKDAIKEIKCADTLIIGGTSLVVYPAAGFINFFKGKNLVIINKDKTYADKMANLVINDSIAKVFSKISK